MLSQPRHGSPFLAMLRSLLLLSTIVALFTSLSAGTRFDFDGDSRADLSVFRPTNGFWYLSQTTNGFTFFRFGQNGDQPVAHDYDGDGKTDAAVYRGGSWYRLKSSSNTYDVIPYGVQGDIPSPADFDGDGRADIAVFRPPTGQWFRILSESGAFATVSFGRDGDIPVPADYDGDGRADISVFRPENGTWYRLNTGNGGSYFVRQFGQNGDLPLVADFDGDGLTDLAVWRPSNSYWYIHGSTNTYTVFTFGISTDIPVPADYDGDGRADISVYRPSSGSWYRINSGASTYQIQQFGTESDIPSPGITTPPASPAPTPTPTATPSPTPVSSPSPIATPTPVPAPFSCDYFAAPTGTSTGTGSVASPWDLQTGLSKTLLVTAGKTLCLRGGTYVGKFRSTLMGGTVRSTPGEWAKIDGHFTTTLVNAINASQTVFDVADASQIATPGSQTIMIGEEVLGTYSKSGNTITSGVRGGNSTTATSHAAGSVVYAVGNQLTISGSNTVYRDFEVTSTYLRRVAPRFSTEERVRGSGIVQSSGDNNKFINLIVSEQLNGFQGNFNTSNTEIYGCIVYNNGMVVESGVGTGNGLYIQNSAGYARVYDVITVNNFAHGVQAYGTGAAFIGGDMRGLVAANNGSPIKPVRNMVVGSESIAAPTFNLQDSHFFSPPEGETGEAGIGYGVGITSATINGNYFIGARGLNVSSSVVNLTGANNTFFATGTSANYFTLFSPNRTEYSWNNNSYYNPVSNSYRYHRNSVGMFDFTGWKSATGYDANSTQSLNPMPTTVVVRPNAYETGRANIIIHAASGPSTIDVNLATTGLVHGQGYTVRNAFNYWGPIVASGNYNAASPTITLPLTGAAATVARPMGMTTSPATTCPKFCSLVVIPR